MIDIAVFIFSSFLPCRSCNPPPIFTNAKLSSPLSREDLKKKLYANSKKYFHKYQTLDILSVLQVAWYSGFQTSETYSRM